MRPRGRLALLFVAVLSAACAAALRHAAPADVALLAPRWPGTTVADLERGRTLYVLRCSGCHTLLLPATRRPQEWPRLVDEMAEKARLKPGERDDVVRFLVAVASDAAAAGR